jgi:hypothetical protein
MLRKFAVGSAAAAFIAVAGMVASSAPANAGVHVSIGIPGIFGFWAPGYYYAPPPAAYYGPYAYYGHGPGYYGRGYYGRRYYNRGYYGRGYYGHRYDHGRYGYNGHNRHQNWR